MVPWGYLIHDLERMQRAIQRDPLSMHELEAMAEYNLARSRNLYGSYKNAFNQQATTTRKVPGHMMPDYMSWLKTAQPEVYTYLYGPDTKPVTKPIPRQRDERPFTERRRTPYTYVPPKQAPPPPKQAESCQKFRDECNALGKQGRSCYIALSKKHHPDKGGSTQKFQQLNDCKDKL